MGHCEPPARWPGKGGQSEKSTCIEDPCFSLMVLKVPFVTLAQSIQLLSAWAPTCESVHTYRNTDMHKHRVVDMCIQMSSVTHIHRHTEKQIHTYSHRYMHTLTYSDMQAYKHIHAYAYTSYKHIVYMYMHIHMKMYTGTHIHVYAHRSLQEPIFKYIWACL